MAYNQNKYNDRDQDEDYPRQNYRAQGYQN